MTADKRQKCIIRKYKPEKIDNIFEVIREKKFPSKYSFQKQRQDKKTF